MKAVGVTGRISITNHSSAVGVRYERSPVVIQAPQAHAEDLEDKEWRQELLLQQFAKLRHWHLKAVFPPSVQGSGCLDFVAVP